MAVMTRSMKCRILASCSLAAALGVPGLAFAQDAEGVELAEIIVTAEKTVANVRDVPIAVSVLSGATLDKARVQNLADIARLVPGVEFGNGSGGTSGFITVRGVPPQQFGDPTTLTFVDGFTLGNVTYFNTLDLLDLERVEVLKGPQGSLYGRNSLGGVLNLVSRKPSYEFEGRFQASYGEHETVGAKASISGPIVADKLAVRVSGSLNSHQGYWPNLFTGDDHANSERNSSGRIAIRFDPSESFQSDLVYSLSKSYNNCGDCMNPIRGYDPVPPTNLSSGDLDFNDLEPYSNVNYQGFRKRRLDTLVWTNTYKADAFTVTGITGWAKSKFDALFDFDRSPGDFFYAALGSEIRTDIFSQELRIASSGDTRFKWLVGAYAYKSEEDNRSPSFFPGGIPVLASDATSEIENFAVFTNNTFDVTDALTVGFGPRYDVERRSLSDHLGGINADTESEEFLPKLSLLYRLDPQNNLYATISRGYKSGGVNYYVVPTYEPEYLWNYEVGLKGVSSNRRFAYEVAAYYIDWTNQQVQQASGFFTYIGNAGQTEVYGVEAALHARPTERLTLDLGLAYNHSRYKEFFDTTSAPAYFGFDPDLAGNRLPMAPDWSGSIAAEYVQPLRDGWDVTGRADVRYVGERAIDTNGFMIAEAYVLTNLAISVGNDKVRVTAFAQNAFDERYSTYASLFAGLAPLTSLAPPRVIGIQLDAKF